MTVIPAIVPSPKANEFAVLIALLQSCSSSDRGGAALSSETAYSIDQLRLEQTGKFISLKMNVAFLLFVTNVAPATLSSPFTQCEDILSLLTNIRYSAESGRHLLSLTFSSIFLSFSVGPFRSKIASDKLTWRERLRLSQLQQPEGYCNWDSGLLSLRHLFLYQPVRSWPGMINIRSDEVEREVRHDVRVERRQHLLQWSGRGTDACLS